MRNTMVVLSALVTVGLFAASARAQPLSRDLRLVFNAHQYVIPVYSGRSSSGAPLVFFDDEPVRLLVRFVNWSSESLTVRGAGAPSKQLFKVRLSRRLESGTVEIPVQLTEDGQPILSHETYEGGLQSVDGVSIPPGGLVSIPTVVQSQRLEPGTYELRVTELYVACEPDCGVKNHGGLFVFDIRRSDDIPKQLDRLMRRASHAIDRGELAEADLAIQQMLVLHPRASAAYQMRARAAERGGNWEEAAAAYDVAADLVQRGRDRLRPEAEPHKLIDSLRHLAAEARQRRGRL